MAIKLENKVNVAPPAAGWQYGRIKDETGLNDGTPVDENTYGDFHQFFARMLDKSLITANGLPENDTNGYQYFEALQNIVNSYKVINSFSTNTTLTDAELGCFNVMSVNGDYDFTLPPLAVTNVLQRMKLAKLGTGVTKVLPNGSDTIAPTEEIYLRDGDSVTIVSYGFGWIVEERSRRANYPTNVFASGTVNLTTAHMRTINIINYAGNTTVNLPALAANYDGQIIIFQKQQGGVATLVLNGSDTIYPIQTVTLEDGDSAILMNVLGAHWAIINRFDASLFNAADIWHKVGNSGEPAFATGWSTGGSSGVHFKKSTNGQVTVWGRAATSGAGSLMFVIPSNYRINLSDISGGVPQIMVCGFAYKEDVTSTDKNWTCQINHNNGEVSIVDPASGGAPAADDYWFTMNWQL